MSLIPGKYQHYKNENIDGYFSAMGIPYMGRKVLAMSSPLLEIILDGDTWIIKVTTLVFNLESSFKIGEEYDEKLPNQTLKSKTVFINDHEMQTESISPKDGCKNTRLYFFTEDECIMTLTHEKVDTPGKRYFRRVK